VNVSRDKAIEAMDAITAAGYTAVVEAAVIPTYSAEVLYRVSVPMLTYESRDLREMCDLAESLGLTCRHSLQTLRFEPEDRRAGAV
jgi:hypothetical protein